MIYKLWLSVINMAGSMVDNLIPLVAYLIVTGFLVCMFFIIGFAVLMLFKASGLLFVNLFKRGEE